MSEQRLRSFEQSLPMALLAARENAMTVFRPMLAEFELTEQQWRAMRALRAAHGPVEVSDLAERTSLLAPSLSRILATLESKGLIVRAPVSHDLRRSVISLAQPGEALVDVVAPHSESRYRDIEDHFGVERLNDLIAELHALAALELPVREVAR